mmetsp:Transcript_32698/g.47997  ORF Transcript_32698/g.47997 Transcript_32698/m.47997 type:complete len:170 (-) Transcript_32698:275-784(-)|eukprot:CAMPEP_0195523372 /NCGR_PEP_ID=MMETSP0794_2-20130614/22461_1 /TAXON_ID=515487 /ORGANISM="Stephanopyxis turris, Strain CCMP 815" /LENGTH=169 /DNA_ID=CAMNT_0040653359 /DNA_START=182 /DNA_END=691 /DNA_ORIENTATION=+
MTSTSTCGAIKNCASSTPCLAWCFQSGRHSDGDDSLAKGMFIAGCFGLPWLWVANVLYFRTRVYGLIRCIDMVDLDADETLSRENLVPRVMPNFTDDDSDDSDDEDGCPRLTPAEIDMEVIKWVRRSTIGSGIVFTVFIAWVVVFQTGKSSFPAGWFVMSEDSETATGW